MRTDALSSPRSALVALLASCFLLLAAGPAFAGLPTITLSSAPTWTEGDPAVAIDGGLTLGGTSTTLDSATVMISDPDAGDQLGWGTLPGGVSATPGANMVTFTGTATLAQYEALLQSVTYENTGDDPTAMGLHTTRSFVIQVDDGGNLDTANPTVNVVDVADGPVLSLSGSTPGFTEGGADATVDGGLTVTDPDSSTLTGATVTIGDAAADGNDVLTWNTFLEPLGPNTFSGLTGVLTFSGTMSVALYEQLLQSVAYSNSGDDPTEKGTNTDRSITFAATDGTASGSSPAKTVSVTGVNDAPAVSLSGSPSFTENGSAVALDATLTVTDADDANLTSASVQITDAEPGDSLTFTAVPGLTANFAGDTLSVSGSGPVADYQTLLRSVAFTNSGDDPDAGGTNTDRSIDVQVSDGALPSTTQTQTVGITAVNDPPALALSGSTPSFTEGGAAATVDGGLTLSDADHANLTGATVTITDAEAGDTLTWTDDPGLTENLVGATLTITGTGTVADYRALLRSVQYENTGDDPTAKGTNTDRSIDFQATDGTDASGVATKTVTVTGVNDAPTVALSGSTPTFTENGAAVTVDGALTVADADNVNLTGATVTITDAEAGDTLTWTDDPGLTENFAGDTLTVTGSGTVAAYQALLRSVQYANSGEDPTNLKTGPANADRQIDFEVTDGSAPSTAQTKTVGVTAVNDAPVLTTTVAHLTYNSGSGAQVVDSALALSDVDGDSLTTVTAAITANFASGQDSLSLSPQPGAITAVFAGSTLTITSAGTPTLAQWRAALRQVKFANSSPGPAENTRTVTFSVDDGLPSGTDTADRLIDVFDVTPPVVSNLTMSPQFGTQYTNTTTPSFTWDVSEQSSFTCAFNGGPGSACGSGNGAAAGTVVAPAQTQGSHTITVTAADLAAPTPNTGFATKTFFVDTQNPVPSLTGQPPLKTNQTSATFSWATGDPGPSSGILSEDCTLDAATIVGCGTGTKTYAGPLAEGPHTFSVTVTDRATNSATTSGYTWEVDVREPDTNFTGTLPGKDQDGTAQNSPTFATQSQSASFTFASTDPAYSAGTGNLFQCRLDGGAWGACNSGTKSYAGLAHGAHTFQVRAIDDAGNVDSTPYTWDWFVDRHAPDVVEVYPYSGGRFSFFKDVKADYSCDDHVGPPYPSESGVQTCLGQVPVGTPFDHTTQGNPGDASYFTYPFSVTRTDKVGNTTAAPFTYRVYTFKGLILDDDPYAYFRMDDPEGSAALVDASGNGRDGEYKNGTESGPIGVSGDGNTARVFTGADGYGYVNDMPAPARQYSMAAFVQFDDGEDGMVMQHGRAGALFRRGDAFVFRQVEEEVELAVPGGIVPGCWYFVGGRFDGFHATVYAGTHDGPGECTNDGTELRWFTPQTISSSSQPSGEGSTFYVGYGEHAPWLHGMLDEVAYFDHDIGATHIKEIWLADPPPGVRRTGSTYRESSSAAPAAPVARPARPAAAKPNPRAAARARAKALTRQLAKAKAHLRALQRRHAPKRRIATARRQVVRLQRQLRAAKRRA